MSILLFTSTISACFFVLDETALTGIIATPNEFGNKSSLKKLQDRVDEIIASRASKTEEKNIYVAKIQNIKKIDSIMDKLGVPVLGDLKQDQVPFDSNSTVGYSASPLELLMGKVATDEFLSEGKIAISSFNMVVKKKRSFIGLVVDILKLAAI